MTDPPLLLDTHCWIWMQAGNTREFTREGLRAIDKAARDGLLRVSVISIWEIGMLEAKGRIVLQAECGDWVRAALATPGLSLSPITSDIALQASRLPGKIHADPADRILAATARVTGSRLLTRDSRLLDYGKKGFLSIVHA